jgi:hypothetical protein
MKSRVITMNDDFTRIRRVCNNHDHHHNQEKTEEDKRLEENAKNENNAALKRSGKVVENVAKTIKIKMGGNKKQGIFISVISSKTGETLLKE